MIPEYLATLLREHRDAHALSYPPFGNADHGPMTYLALHGLGAGAEAVERFARSYRKKLAPLPATGARLTPENWQQELGRLESYPALLAYFDAEISIRGWGATLGHYLPRLLSGGVGGAFHPLIRLAYGIQYKFAPEIAAGLAFLACTGTDVALELASAQPRSVLGGSAYLKSWQQHRKASFSAGPFGERYRSVVQTVPLQPAAASPGGSVAGLSRACLEAFHASHDFFALHLVTGSAAFRTCAPWLEPDADQLFSVALAAAYLAIGAPDLAPIQPDDAALPLRELYDATDEHDIKLAHACRAQSHAFADPRYESVAAHYLSSRLAPT